LSHTATKGFPFSPATVRISPAAFFKKFSPQMCQVRVSEQKSRKPRRGEKFQTALLVSEDFNEESAQKAVGLPLVPLKHGINLGIDPCVQNFYLFARKWLLRHRLLSQRFRKTKEWIIQSWDRIRVMEID